MRFSKLQKNIENLMDESLDLKIRCTKYRMKSQRGHTDLPRYYITLGKKIIWDYPKDFEKKDYPYITDVSEISDLLILYINSNADSIAKTMVGSDKWGLTNILIAADRRFGKKRRETLLADHLTVAIQGILFTRNLKSF